MRTKVTNNEIAHLWAHQTQPHAHTNSIRFEGPRFYSYSTEIARIIEHKGRKAYLLNETSYSNTTNRHMSHVRRSIPAGALAFRIGDIGRGCSLDIKPAVLFDYAIEQAAESHKKAKRARGNGDYWAALEQTWLKRAKSIAEFFGLRRKVDEKAIERLSEQAERARRAELKAGRERQARREQEAADTIQAWLAGDNVYFPYNVSKVYLRALIDDQGNDMQTSKGVRVPLADAGRAFRFVTAMRSKGWHRNGEEFKVGDFQLDAVNEQGVVAGCHRIGWDEIERFAKTQNWL